MNFYAFHIGDYASSTRHLSWIEDAAYRRLLDWYYVREEQFPLDHRQIYRLVAASTDEQREAVDQVLSEFFVQTESGYMHERCESEIYCANDKKNKASLSAQERWRIARESDCALPVQSERNASASNSECERIAIVGKTACEGNAPNPNPNPNPNKTTTREPVGFAEFWAAYPKKVGKGAAEKAFRNARINGALSDVLLAIKRQSSSDQWRKDGGQFIPNPATWINQRRWEDGDVGQKKSSDVVADFMREMCS
jgi:uncharacterized protein YdaU (DUF1376 family)